MKQIHPTEDYKAKALEEFKTYLDGLKTNTGKITFSKTLEEVKLSEGQTPIIYFTLKAKAKMRELVQASTKEIGWHGIVRVLSPTEYLIEDVILYPQLVTASTVDTDDAEYGNWLDSLDDDVIGNVRMHGHSHVRMGTTPSGVDQDYYDRILGMLPQDGFYIFMILNKSDDLWCNLYDLKNNLIYEKKDIAFATLDEDGNEIEGWVDVQIKQHVQDKKIPSYTTPTYAQPATAARTTYVRDHDSEMEAYYDRLYGRESYLLEEDYPIPPPKEDFQKNKSVWIGGQEFKPNKRGELVLVKGRK